MTLVTAAAFLPALEIGFTDWDDPAYVINNHLVRDLSPAGIGAIFSSYVEGNYHPLTVLSLAVDYRFSKLNPAGYHRTAVVLHVLAALAVYWMILLLTGSPLVSAGTALFFGIHPLHVESVAWVSARKDLLYALFYVLSCAAYIVWARREPRRPALYVAALGLFLLSLLSKGMAVTLPLALLAIDYYMGRRLTLRAVLLEKAPFFALSIVFGLIAVAAQRSAHAVGEFADFSWIERTLFACHALAAYVCWAVAPVTLSAFHPYPGPPGTPLPLSTIAAPVVVLLGAAAVAASRRWGKDAAFGVLFFVVNVALVLQLLPVGSAALADRYTYVSYVGLGFVLASGLARVLMDAGTGRALRIGIVGLGIAFFSMLFVTTRERIPVWGDDIRLWSDVLRRYPECSKAFAQRGWSYFRRGRTEEAMADLTRALARNPDEGEALNVRGTIYLLEKDYPRARADLDRGVVLRPRSWSAWNNRGLALLNLGETEAATADFTRAIDLNRNYRPAYLNRALALCMRREFARAIPDFTTAIAFQREDPQPYVSRGVARAQIGDIAGAIEDFDSALKLDPGNADALAFRATLRSGSP